MITCIRTINFQCTKSATVLSERGKGRGLGDSGGSGILARVRRSVEWPRLWGLVWGRAMHQGRSDGGYIDIHTLPKSGQVNFYGVSTMLEQLLDLFHDEF